MIGRRIVFHTLSLAAPAAAALAALALPLWGPNWATCFLLSVAWAALNLLALGWLLEVTLHGGGRARLVLAVLAKLACLGGGAALLASLPVFSPSAFLAGFHVSLGAAALSLLRPKSAPAAEVA